jgi:hypothetical protein
VVLRPVRFFRMEPGRRTWFWWISESLQACFSRRSARDSGPGVTVEVAKRRLITRARAPVVLLYVLCKEYVEQPGCWSWGFWG